METMTSRDGELIAFERSGKGRGRGRGKSGDTPA
jgi:hypothetical protein